MALQGVIECSYLLEGNKGVCRGSVRFFRRDLKQQNISRNFATSSTECNPEPLDPSPLPRRALKGKGISGLDRTHLSRGGDPEPETYTRV